ncbi:ubiquinol-cytochrome-c reductase complex assembly factor 2 [Pelobates cultripes]|uniref:Mitochondrial nucleoid factor 1 n=1 Tax=Pelobates cultripes TaxID=61616 RepID=A0AAD1R0G9_PELCU|nr:ubiquinol-cytochrome-c reductase complex assembly factor 2 [Pelobates cultripes]
MEIVTLIASITYLSVYFLDASILGSQGDAGACAECLFPRSECLTRDQEAGLPAFKYTYISENIFWGMSAYSPPFYNVQDLESCDHMFDSLSRINSNFYREKYPRIQDTSFTEVTAEEYRMVLATDSLKQMEEMKKGMWTRLKEKFNAKSPQDGAKD